MTPPRNRLARLLLWSGLVLFSLRPLAAVDRAVETLAAPLRAVTGLASPLKLLRRREVAAAETRLAASAAAEAEESLRLLLDLVRYARPTEPALVEGRRFVHGEVLGRVAESADRLRARVRDVRGLAVGMPVASGNAYAGRVAEIAPDPRPPGGIVLVDLVTARSFHVGARVAGAAGGEDVFLTVGGLDVPPGRPGGEEAAVRLAVHHPSDRELAGGIARVHELFADAEPFAALAAGFVLGAVRRDPSGARWSIEPALDYKDGLFWVVILAPPDPALPAREPVAEEIFAAEWARATPLAVGDASPWREAVRIAGGRARGMEAGAAVTARGRRLVGRVARAGPWTADVSFLGDPGFSVVAVARLEGLAAPQVLGRLVSLGRDRRDGTVLFRWVKRVELALPAGEARAAIPARLYTGSGDAGLSCGYFLGEGEIPLAGDLRIIRLATAAEPRDLGALYVRVAAGGEEEP
ncbi:MAG: hypothetical protein AB1726_09035 [Planctomycetota bacterium]